MNSEASIQKEKKQSFIYFLFIIALVLLMILGINYNDSWIIPVEKDIEKYLNISTSKFLLVYTIYSIPNVISPFLIGHFASIYSPIVGFILILAISIIGQFIVYLSFWFSIKSYIIFMAGTFIYAAGAGTRHSLLFYFLKVKFLAIYLSVAIGIENTFCKFNNWAIFLFLPRIVKRCDIDFLPLIGLILILLSFIISIILKFTPPHFEAEYKEPIFTIKNIAKESWINVGAFIIILSWHFIFTDISSSYLQDNFHISELTAGYIISWDPIIEGSTAIIIGIILAFIPSKKYALIIESSWIVLIFFDGILLLSGQTYNEILLILMFSLKGFCFGWISTCLILNILSIEKKSEGKALGIAYGGINLLFIVLPTLTGSVIASHSPKGYRNIILLFATFKSVALFLYFLGYFCMSHIKPNQIENENEQEKMINN